jgi:predicted nucleic acid-binding protein
MLASGYSFHHRQIRRPRANLLLIAHLVEAREQMNTVARKVTPAEAIYVVKEDPADDRILECAEAARSDYIVTGDDDLLRVETFRDIPIVKVANFLELAAKHARGL